MARRVLITGGAGFLGVNAAAHLAGQGWHVTVLDNLSRAGTDRNLAWLRKNHAANVEFVEHDLRQYAGLDAHVKGQDAIVHLAGQVAVTTSLLDPDRRFRDQRARHAQPPRSHAPSKPERGLCLRIHEQGVRTATEKQCRL